MSRDAPIIRHVQDQSLFAIEQSSHCDSPQVFMSAIFTTSRGVKLSAIARGVNL
jgi:hypothetical protein